MYYFRLGVHCICQNMGPIYEKCIKRNCINKANYNHLSYDGKETICVTLRLMKLQLQNIKQHMYVE